MKKILLASTALCAFAGAAAAEVTVKGTAEMGVTSADGFGRGPEHTTQFHNSYNLNFVMSGETDTGLAFGATYRLDADGSSEENQDPAGDNGTAWISGAFGKLTLGDTDGALDWALTETAMGTSITDEGTSWPGYSGNSDGYYDDQVLRYEYSFGDFAVAASMEQDDGNGEAAGYEIGDEMIGLGIKYATSLGGVDLGFGLGYQTGQSSKFISLGATAPDDMDVIGASISASTAFGLTAVLNYVDYDMGDSSDRTYYGIGLGYETGALLVAANYGKWEFDDEITYWDNVVDEADGFGVVVNYDLGGGAILAAGWASDVSTERGDQDRWSIGMNMSF
ncbi:porin [Frigidibacter sp. MR17.24]|uniref:porin n=1 Tax=Frigidibacter sp. MR17.24 TaxID=3127345 RepID=UPI003013073E